MSKHTTGEWDVNEFNDLDGDHHVQVVLKSNGCPLAHMYETGSETKANARLMATAPELLALVERLALLTEEGDDQIKGSAYIDRAGVIRAKGSLLETIQQARAAIAKATGAAA